MRGVQAAQATVRAGVPLLALLLAAGAAQVRHRPQGLRRQQRFQDAPGKSTKWIHGVLADLYSTSSWS